MTKKLQGLYKGNVGSLLGNIYLNPCKKKTIKYKRKILEVRPGFLKDDYSDLLLNAGTKTYSTITLDGRLDIIEELRKNEKTVTGTQTAIEQGFVYLVKNDSFPGWVKAGMTINYEDRLNTYNLYSPMKNFKMLATKWVADRRLCEKILLEELGKFSAVTDGEWFKIDELLALSIFNS